MFFFNTEVITLFQIGEAPVTPEVKRGFIGELSLFPTHTAVKNLRLYPSVQLSFLLFVVPVFTETVKSGMCRSEFTPKANCRAKLSARISEIINDVSSESTL